jgi:hypothetical protein
MKELLSLKDVDKYYEMGDNIVKALDGINIKIEQGDFGNRARHYGLLPTRRKGKIAEHFL